MHVETRCASFDGIRRGIWNVCNDQTLMSHRHCTLDYSRVIASIIGELSHLINFYPKSISFLLGLLVFGGKHWIIKITTQRKQLLLLDVSGHINRHEVKYLLYSKRFICARYYHLSCAFIKTSPRMSSDISSLL